jgi:sigma-B regulation protein RsbU (phosphoserine phosphatase)
MPSPGSQFAPPSATNPPKSGFFSQLERFWQRVTEGLALSQLWKQFRADARASYRLYRHDYDARSPRESTRHHFLQSAQELTWAILEKLTPARRVLLLLGFVLLIFPGGGFSYVDKTGNLEIEELDLHFYGGALIFIVLMLEVSDRVVMKRDLEIARDIQGWLLPGTPPPVPGVALAFATRPANTVAGDFYDVFARTPDGGQPRYLITVADVAGKSIPAALLMATYQASLRTLSDTAARLPELVSAMNHYACTNSQNGLRFTTAFMGEYDPAGRTLTYINAGHNAPIVRHLSGSIERLDRGGLPLGISPDRTYESGKITLQSGDWLVIFTDGLIEAVNSQDEEYGEGRLLNIILAGVHSTPDELLRRMMGDLDAFVGPTPQHDDVTCLLMKVG